VSTGKLEALVGLAETTDCRRTRLLGYLAKARRWQMRQLRQLPVAAARSRRQVIAQKLLSCAYRTGQRFGAMHLIDVLIGRMTERVKQFGTTKSRCLVSAAN